MKPCRISLLFLLFLAAPDWAFAQTAVSCTATSNRCYWEDQPCTAGSCTRTAAPTTAEFLVPKGLGLSGMKGASLMMCAPAGHTLTGTGTIRYWVWYPHPLPNGRLGTNAVFQYSVAELFVDNGCDGSDCQCLPVPAEQVPGQSGMRVIAQAVGVGINPADSDVLLRFYWEGHPL